MYHHLQYSQFGVRYLSYTASSKILPKIASRSARSWCVGSLLGWLQPSVVPWKLMYHIARLLILICLVFRGISEIWRSSERIRTSGLLLCWSNTHIHGSWKSGSSSSTISNDFFPSLHKPQTCSTNANGEQTESSLRMTCSCSKWDVIRCKPYVAWQQPSLRELDESVYVCRVCFFNDLALHSSQEITEDKAGGKEEKYPSS